MTKTTKLLSKLYFKFSIQNVRNIAEHGFHKISMTNACIIIYALELNNFY